MPDIFRFHGFTLDTAARALVGPLGSVALRPKAFALLELFVRRAGRALGKDEILQAVWVGVTVTDETLTQTVHELRRALGDDGQALIRTVPRRGYLFPVDALEPVPRHGCLLAVLPFENLSSDPEQQFFAAGLRLDLEAALGLVGGLDLRADPTVADFHLTGGVRVASGSIRVTARLSEADGGRQLWSGRFEGRADDIFSFQDEITRKIAIAMQVELTKGDSARLWDGQTSSLSAWERYVVAHGYYLRWTEADNSRARDLLREALEIDPTYVTAKVMLAKTWWYDARFYTRGADRLHAIAETERIVKEVLLQRPDTANALMTLGGAAWLRDGHDEAIAHCRRACELSPSDAWVLGFSGMIHIFSGDLAEAQILLARAERLSPQTFAWVDYHIAHARAWNGDHEGALPRITSYVATTPEDPWGYLMLAVVHSFAGRTSEACIAVADALRRQADLNMEQFRRSHRYRDPDRLGRVTAMLHAAGLQT